MKKAQSAIELLILVGVMLFIFIGFLFVFQNNVSQKTVENRNQEALELTITVKNEIDIAAGTTDGYSRTFQIPETIFRQDYNLTIEGDVLYFTTSDGSISLSLPSQQVTGQLQKGANTIQKLNGEILLNQ